MKHKYLLTLYLTLCHFMLMAQDINQLDANGERHGTWQKKYEGSNQLRYTGTFNHGQEIGVFTFYSSEGGEPIAIKRYTSGSDLVDVSFYTNLGKKVSEGIIKGRSREGKWNYYHSDGISLLSTENYVNGLKEGLRTEYFSNGSKALEETYKNGKREGISKYYTEEGTLLKELAYKEDIRQGLARLYDAYGNLLKEGAYKNNKKHGIWKYYEHGILSKEVKFPQNRIGVEH